MIRVLLVDDQSLLRMAFRLILEGEPDIKVIGEATRVSMAPALHPDGVLMDVRMSGMDGNQATVSITHRGPVSKVLILAAFDLDQYVFAGLKPAPADSCSKTRHLLNCLRLSARSPAETRSSPPTATRRLIDQFAPLLPDPE